MFTETSFFIWTNINPEGQTINFRNKKKETYPRELTSQQIQTNFLLLVKLLKEEKSVNYLAVFQQKKSTYILNGKEQYLD